MRGTPVTDTVIDSNTGITPAHAGNTGIFVVVNTPIRDHPRTCGEHALFSSQSPHTSGSPPHMRGTLGINQIQIGSGRITPAHAGNTHLRPCFPISSRDHPRTCGEHSVFSFLVSFGIGSPPHMRGTHIYVHVFQFHHGITPAHAGNT